MVRVCHCYFCLILRMSLLGIHYCGFVHAIVYEALYVPMFVLSNTEQQMTKHVLWMGFLGRAWDCLGAVFGESLCCLGISQEGLG